MENQKIEYKGGGDRIDLFLKTLLPYSREFIKKLILSGNISVNSKRVKPSFVLSEGDMVEIAKEAENKKDILLDDIKIYEDEDILVLNKPFGLLVHPTDDNWNSDLSALNFSKDSLVWLLYSQKFSKDMEKLDRLGLVHRLDADTSGVMVIAKNVSAQKKLIEQFSKREVFKNYKAVSSGVFEKEELTIDAPIGRFSGSKKLEVMEYGRDAVTEIKVIKKGKQNTYLDIFPKTGRTNQIRVHLSFINHPIIGDRIYSKTNYDRLMLHSNKISFLHPSKNKKVSFEAELDPDFKRRLSKLV
ncbi:MAG: RluA family pseudouridine synthase [Elusimicrobiales bacterium]